VYPYIKPRPIVSVQTFRLFSLSAFPENVFSLGKKKHKKSVATFLVNRGIIIVQKTFTIQLFVYFADFSNLSDPLLYARISSFIFSGFLDSVEFLEKGTPLTI
jgi:hypothetical protein